MNVQCLPIIKTLYYRHYDSCNRQLISDYNVGHHGHCYMSGQVISESFSSIYHKTFYISNLFFLRWQPSQDLKSRPWSNSKVIFSLACKQSCSHFLLRLTLLLLLVCRLPVTQPTNKNFPQYSCFVWLNSFSLYMFLSNCLYVPVYIVFQDANKSEKTAISCLDTVVVTSWQVMPSKKCKTALAFSILYFGDAHFACGILHILVCGDCLYSTSTVQTILAAQDHCTLAR